jgi:transcriptional regulator of NAD metabolism
MDGNARRDDILKELQMTTQPLSGTYFSKKYHVSRQVIVTDIALIRAHHHDIISTNKGYILLTDTSPKEQRVIYVEHDNEHINDELNTIVDLGGKVLNVIVDHELYGQVTAPLIINNRREVLEFVGKVKKTSAIPLKQLCDGKHYHTIEAENNHILDMIEEELDKKGYLVRKLEN